MKLNTFEKIIRKVIREEIDYALAREFTLLKEQLHNNSSIINEKIKDKKSKDNFREKITEQLPNFNTGNNTLDSLLNETAITPSKEEIFEANDPVNQFINKDYGPLLKAIEKNKNFRP